MLKWIELAFELTEQKSLLKKEIDLSQQKIREINESLDIAKLRLESFLERDDVTCEELNLQERQLLILNKIIMKKSRELFLKAIRVCLESVKEFNSNITDKSIYYHN